MLKRLTSLFVLSSFLSGLLFVQPAAAAPAQSASDPAAGQLTSPAGLLNADGTLKLDGHFSGSLNLKGWDVQMDPQRGPMFAPAAQPDSSVAVAPAPSHWGDVGGGGEGSLNDNVAAIAVVGTDVYVGGSFVDADNIPAADYIAKWDGSSWSSVSSNGSGDGAVTAGVRSLAVIGTNLYVGGSFTFINDNGTNLLSARYLAKWDGTHWSGVGSNGSGGGSLNGDVLAMAASGSNLYVGGTFTNVNNNGTVLNAADYIAKWDGSNWSALGSNGASDGSLGFWVTAVAVSGSNVYAGGLFTNVNNNGTVLGAADYVAKWDGTNWSALSSNGSGNGSLNSTVNALAVIGSDLYVGGSFTTVNDNGTLLHEARSLARWNGTNWFAVGNGGTNVPSLNGVVAALFVNGTDLYVGGYFTDVKNGATTLTAADYIAKWDGSNWSALGDNGAGGGAILNNGVAAIAMVGSTVYTGGYFLGVNNHGTLLNYAQNIAQWNGSNWSALGSVQGSINHQVQAVAISGANVYVGGYFTNLSNHGITLPAADYIAKWDGSNWSALGNNGQGDGSLNWVVFAITVSGSDVYAGGWFASVYNSDGNNVPAAHYVAKWDGTNWSGLGGDGAGGGSLNNRVNAIAISGSNVYVGGNFTNVNNGGTVLTAADYVAKWDGNNWSALGSNGASDGSLNSDVNALAVSGSDVYVGGFFADVKNGATILGAADYIAKWDGSNWSALGSDGAGGGSLQGPVYAVAISGTDIYVGGTFGDVNNNGTILGAADFIAEWDGSNWSALGSDGAGGGSLNNAVYAIAISGSSLYAAGNFTDVNNNGVLLPAADFIAKWDGSNWSALGSNGAGDGSVSATSNPLVSAVAANSSSVYIGGQFFNVNDNGTSLPYADYLAVYANPLFVATFNSLAAQDGWILESKETSNTGGSMNSTATTLQLGDDSSNRQYRVILAFNTSTLPANAIISAATLQMKQSGLVAGRNPFNIFGNLWVDIHTSYFGTARGLQLTDFRDATSASKVASFNKTPNLGWYYTTAMSAAGLGMIASTGQIQFRLYFTLDDNNNHRADFMKFLSGNSTANKPMLVVDYYMP